MSEAENELKRDLECLRLASDFTRLSGAALNPELREHCIRMAKYWSDQATGEPKVGPGECEGPGSAFMTQASNKGPAVILVVEDEPMLRDLAVEVIEDAGFVALEAGNADEAVDLLETRPDIAVLFTDINMPGSMDGLMLAHTVHDRWPPIKILIASGLVRLKQSDLPTNSIFLEKPYRGEAVIVQLRRLLDPTRSLIGCDLQS